MVFSQYIASALTTYLGSFIKDVDKESVNVSLLRGSVQLRNLEPLPSILPTNIPVQLVRAIIGSLSLRIPWARLYSQQCVVQINDVCVVLSSSSEEDTADALHNILSHKLKMLELFKLTENIPRDEPNTQQSHNDSQPTSEQQQEKKRKSTSGFFDRLRKSILNNIRLEINGLTIRFESPTSASPSAPRTVSVVLKIPTVKCDATDENYQTCFIKEDRGTIYRNLSYQDVTLHVSNSSVEDAAMSGSDIGQSRTPWRAMGCQEFIDACQRTPCQKYASVLDPSHGNVYVSYTFPQPDAKEAGSCPVVNMTVAVKPGAVHLRHETFEAVLSLLKTVLRAQSLIQQQQQQQQQEKCCLVPPANRPSASNAREWWHFAIASVRHTIQERHARSKFDWDKYRAWKEKCYRYYVGVLAELNAPWIAISDARERSLTNLENDADLSLDDLIDCRKQAKGAVEDFEQTGAITSFVPYLSVLLEQIERDNEKLPVGLRNSSEGKKANTATPVTAAAGPLPVTLRIVLEWSLFSIHLDDDMALSVERLSATVSLDGTLFSARAGVHGVSIQYRGASEAAATPPLKGERGDGKEVATVHLIRISNENDADKNAIVLACSTDFANTEPATVEVSVYHIRAYMDDSLASALVAKALSYSDLGRYVGVLEAGECAVAAPRPSLAKPQQTPGAAAQSKRKDIDIVVSLQEARFGLGDAIAFTVLSVSGEKMADNPVAVFVEEMHVVAAGAPLADIRAVRLMPEPHKSIGSVTVSTHVSCGTVSLFGNLDGTELVKEKCGELARLVTLGFGSTAAGGDETPDEAKRRRRTESAAADHSEPLRFAVSARLFEFDAVQLHDFCLAAALKDGWHLFLTCAGVSCGETVVCPEAVLNISLWADSMLASSPYSNNIDDDGIAFTFEAWSFNLRINELLTSCLERAYDMIALVVFGDEDPHVYMQEKEKHPRAHIRGAVILHDSSVCLLDPMNEPGGVALPGVAPVPTLVICAVGPRALVAALDRYNDKRMVVDVDLGEGLTGFLEGQGRRVELLPFREGGELHVHLSMSPPCAEDLPLFPYSRLAIEVTLARRALLAHVPTIMALWNQFNTPRLPLCRLRNVPSRVHYSFREERGRSLPPRSPTSARSVEMGFAAFVQSQSGRPPQAAAGGPYSVPIFPGDMYLSLRASHAELYYPWSEGNPAMPHGCIPDFRLFMSSRDSCLRVELQGRMTFPTVRVSTLQTCNSRRPTFDAAHTKGRGSSHTHPADDGTRCTCFDDPVLAVKMTYTNDSRPPSHTGIADEMLYLSVLGCQGPGHRLFTTIFTDMGSRELAAWMAMMAHGRGDLPPAHPDPVPQEPRRLFLKLRLAPCVLQLHSLDLVVCLWDGVDFDMYPGGKTLQVPHVSLLYSGQFRQRAAFMTPAGLRGRIEDASATAHNGPQSATPVHVILDVPTFLAPEASAADDDGAGSGGGSDTDPEPKLVLHSGMVLTDAQSQRRSERKHGRAAAAAVDGVDVKRELAVGPTTCCVTEELFAEWMHTTTAKAAKVSRLRSAIAACREQLRQSYEEEKLHYGSPTVFPAPTEPRQEQQCGSVAAPTAAPAPPPMRYRLRALDVSLQWWSRWCQRRVALACTLEDVAYRRGGGGDVASAEAPEVAIGFDLSVRNASVSMRIGETSPGSTATGDGGEPGRPPGWHSEVLLLTGLGLWTEHVPFRTATTTATTTGPSPTHAGGGRRSSASASTAAAADYTVPYVHVSPVCLAIYPTCYTLLCELPKRLQQLKEEKRETRRIVRRQLAGHGTVPGGGSGGSATVTPPTNSMAAALFDPRFGVRYALCSGAARRNLVYAVTANVRGTRRKANTILRQLAILFAAERSPPSDTRQPSEGWQQGRARPIPDTHGSANPTATARARVTWQMAGFAVRFVDTDGDPASANDDSSGERSESSTTTTDDDDAADGEGGGIRGGRRNCSAAENAVWERLQRTSYAAAAAVAAASPADFGASTTNNPDEILLPAHSAATPPLRHWRLGSSGPYLLSRPARSSLTTGGRASASTRSGTSAVDEVLNATDKLSVRVSAVAVTIYADAWTVACGEITCLHDQPLSRTMLARLHFERRQQQQQRQRSSSKTGDGTSAATTVAAADSASKTSFLTSTTYSAGTMAEASLHHTGGTTMTAVGSVAGSVGVAPALLRARGLDVCMPATQPLPRTEAELQSLYAAVSGKMGPDMGEGGKVQNSHEKCTNHRGEVLPPSSAAPSPSVFGRRGGSDKGEGGGGGGGGGGNTSSSGNEGGGVARPHMSLTACRVDDLYAEVTAHTALSLAAFFVERPSKALFPYYNKKGVSVTEDEGREGEGEEEPRAKGFARGPVITKIWESTYELTEDLVLSRDGRVLFFSSAETNHITVNLNGHTITLDVLRAAAATRRARALQKRRTGAMHANAAAVPSSDRESYTKLRPHEGVVLIVEDGLVVTLTGGRVCLPLYVWSRSLLDRAARSGVDHVLLPYMALGEGSYVQCDNVRLGFTETLGTSTLSTGSGIYAGASDTDSAPSHAFSPSTSASSSSNSDAEDDNNNYSSREEDGRHANVDKKGDGKNSPDDNDNDEGLTAAFFNAIPLLSASFVSPAAVAAAVMSGRGEGEEEGMSTSALRSVLMGKKAALPSEPLKAEGRQQQQQQQSDARRPRKPQKQPRGPPALASLPLSASNSLVPSSPGSPPSSLSSSSSSSADSEAESTTSSVRAVTSPLSDSPCLPATHEGQTPARDEDGALVGDEHSPGLHDIPLSLALPKTGGDGALGGGTSTTQQPQQTVGQPTRRTTSTPLPSTTASTQTVERHLQVVVAGVRLCLHVEREPRLLLLDSAMEARVCLHGTSATLIPDPAAAAHHLPRQPQPQQQQQHLIRSEVTLQNICLHTQLVGATSTTASTTILAPTHLDFRSSHGGRHHALALGPLVVDITRVDIATLRGLAQDWQGVAGRLSYMTSPRAERKLLTLIDATLSWKAVGAAEVADLTSVHHMINSQGGGEDVRGDSAREAQEREGSSLDKEGRRKPQRSLNSDGRMEEEEEEEEKRGQGPTLAGAPSSAEDHLRVQGNDARRGEERGQRTTSSPSSSSSSSTPSTLPPLRRSRAGSEGHGCDEDAAATQTLQDEGHAQEAAQQQQQQQTEVAMHELANDDGESSLAVYIPAIDVTLSDHRYPLVRAKTEDVILRREASLASSMRSVSLQLNRLQVDVYGKGRWDTIIAPSVMLTLARTQSVSRHSSNEHVAVTCDGLQVRLSHLLVAKVLYASQQLGALFATSGEDGGDAADESRGEEEAGEDPLRQGSALNEEACGDDDNNDDEEDELPVIALRDPNTNSKSARSIQSHGGVGGGGGGARSAPPPPLFPFRAVEGSATHRFVNDFTFTFFLLIGPDREADAHGDWFCLPPSTTIDVLIPYKRADDLFVYLYPSDCVMVVPTNPSSPHSQRLQSLPPSSSSVRWSSSSNNNNNGSNSQEKRREGTTGSLARRRSSTYYEDSEAGPLSLPRTPSSRPQVEGKEDRNDTFEVEVDDAGGNGGGGGGEDGDGDGSYPGPYRLNAKGKRLDASHARVRVSELQYGKAAGVVVSGALVVLSCTDHHTGGSDNAVAAGGGGGSGGGRGRKAAGTARGETSEITYVASRWLDGQVAAATAKDAGEDGGHSRIGNGERVPDSLKSMPLPSPSTDADAGLVVVRIHAKMTLCNETGVTLTVQQRLITDNSNSNSSSSSSDNSNTVSLGDPYEASLGEADEVQEDRRGRLTTLPTGYHCPLQGSCSDVVLRCRHGVITYTAEINVLAGESGAFVHLYPSTPSQSPAQAAPRTDSGRCDVLVVGEEEGSRGNDCVGRNEEEVGDVLEGTLGPPGVIRRSRRQQPTRRHPGPTTTSNRGEKEGDDGPALLRSESAATDSRPLTIFVVFTHIPESLSTVITVYPRLCVVNHTGVPVKVTLWQVDPRAGPQSAADRALLEPWLPAASLTRDSGGGGSKSSHAADSPTWPAGVKGSRGISKEKAEFYRSLVPLAAHDDLHHKQALPVLQCTYESGLAMALSLTQSAGDTMHTADVEHVITNLRDAVDHHPRLLTMRDSTGRTFYVQVNVLARTIIISVGVWVCNLTEYPLLLSDSVVTRRLCAGQSANTGIIPSQGAPFLIGCKLQDFTEAFFRVGLDGKWSGSVAMEVGSSGVFESTQDELGITRSCNYAIQLPNAQEGRPIVLLVTPRWVVVNNTDKRLQLFINYPGLSALLEKAKGRLKAKKKEVLEAALLTSGLQSPPSPATARYEQATDIAVVLDNDSDSDGDDNPPTTTTTSFTSTQSTAAVVAAANPTTTQMATGSSPAPPRAGAIPAEVLAAVESHVEVMAAETTLAALRSIARVQLKPGEFHVSCVGTVEGNQVALQENLEGIVPSVTSVTEHRVQHKDLSAFYESQPTEYLSVDTPGQATFNLWAAPRAPGKQAAIHYGATLLAYRSRRFDPTGLEAFDPFAQDAVVTGRLVVSVQSADNVLAVVIQGVRATKIMIQNRTRASTVMVRQEGSRRRNAVPARQNRYFLWEDSRSEHTIRVHVLGYKGAWFEVDFTHGDCRVTRRGEVYQTPGDLAIGTGRSNSSSSRGAARSERRDETEPAAPRQLPFFVRGYSNADKTRVTVLVTEREVPSYAAVDGWRTSRALSVNVSYLKAWWLIEMGQMGSEYVSRVRERQQQQQKKETQKSPPQQRRHTHFHHHSSATDAATQPHRLLLQHQQLQQQSQEQQMSATEARFFSIAMEGVEVDLLETEDNINAFVAVHQFQLIDEVNEVVFAYRARLLLPSPPPPPPPPPAPPRPAAAPSPTQQQQHQQQPSAATSRSALFPPSLAGTPRAMSTRAHFLSQHGTPTTFSSRLPPSPSRLSILQCSPPPCAGTTTPATTPPQQQPQQQQRPSPRSDFVAVQVLGGRRAALDRFLSRFSIHGRWSEKAETLELPNDVELSFSVIKYPDGMSRITELNASLAAMVLVLSDIWLALALKETRRMLALRATVPADRAVRTHMQQREQQRLLLQLQRQQQLRQHAQRESLLRAQKERAGRAAGSGGEQTTGLRGRHGHTPDLPLPQAVAAIRSPMASEPTDSSTSAHITRGPQPPSSASSSSAREPPPPRAPLFGTDTTTATSATSQAAASAATPPADVFPRQVIFTVNVVDSLRQQHQQVRVAGTVVGAPPMRSMNEDGAMGGGDGGAMTSAASSVTAVASSTVRLRSGGLPSSATARRNTAHAEGPSASSPAAADPASDTTTRAVATVVPASGSASHRARRRRERRSRAAAAARDKNKNASAADGFFVPQPFIYVERLRVARVSLFITFTRHRPDPLRAVLGAYTLMLPSQLEQREFYLRPFTLTKHVETMSSLQARLKRWCLHGLREQWAKVTKIGTVLDMLRWWRTTLPLRPPPVPMTLLLIERWRSRLLSGKRRREKGRNQQQDQGLHGGGGGRDAVVDFLSSQSSSPSMSAVSMPVLSRATSPASSLAADSDVSVHILKDNDDADGMGRSTGERDADGDVVVVEENPKNRTSRRLLAKQHFHE